MAVGTTTALVLAGISAGSKVASSAIAAKGAKSAAKTQAAGADKAAEAMESFNQAHNARMQPFVDYGTRAYTTLGDLMGMGPGGATSQLQTGAQMPGPPNAQMAGSPGGMPPGGMGQPGMPPQGMPPGMPPGGPPPPPSGGPSEIPPGMPPPAAAQSQSGYRTLGAVMAR